ncbi:MULTISPECIES: class I SAM-dependent methyltransferase [Deferrisoma]
MLPPEKARAIRDRIRANFDRGAEGYDRFEAETSHFQELTRALLSLAPPGAVEGARVLDVGCGTGASTRILREAAGPRGAVVGCDLSPGMLRVARERVPGVRFLVADACRLEALRGPFDLVVYNAVLFMLPDAAASVRGARRLLRPGGALLASFLEGVYEAETGRPVPDLLAEMGYEPGRHAVLAWDRVLEALGREFGEIRTRRLRLPLPPERFLGFYGLEPMSAGLLPRLPYPERRRAVEALAERWARNGGGAVQVWDLVAAEAGAETEARERR